MCLQSHRGIYSLEDLVISSLLSISLPDSASEASRCIVFLASARSPSTLFDRILSNFTDMGYRPKARGISKTAPEILIPIFRSDAFGNDKQLVGIILVFDEFQRRVVVTKKCVLPVLLP